MGDLSSNVTSHEISSKFIQRVSIVSFWYGGPLDWNYVLDWPITWRVHINFDPPHLGIGIVYWIGSKFKEYACLSSKSSYYIGVPWIEITYWIGPLSLESKSILTPHLGIGIGYWIGSKFIEYVCLSLKLSPDMGAPWIGIRYWIGP